MKVPLRNIGCLSVRDPNSLWWPPSLIRVKAESESDSVYDSNAITIASCDLMALAAHGPNRNHDQVVITDVRPVRFETYVKAKDLDLWHIILNDDFPSLAKNEVIQFLEVVPFEQQDDDLKKKLATNNEAKMLLYNALPKKEYERIFMCKMAKDIWKSLLITHQGNSQVKDNKIDLLVQQYEQFTIFEEESINSGFVRFNTTITSLKALDEGYSSKNYVRKFLRALHPKWRAKVMAIKESKDLSSLALDELIDNIKVHEVVMKKDSKIYKGKKERIKSIALKANKESSDNETSTSGSDDEEYAMAVMAALVISIFSDVSVESVGSSFLRVILIDSIFVEVPVAPEVGPTAVASHAGALELDTHLSSEADPSESSPPPISVAPMVLPFLCSDESESDTKIPERHVSPTTSTLKIPTYPILPAPSAILAPSSEYPLAPVVAPPGIRQRRAIPREDIPIGRLYRTHLGGPCRALTARK
ncbi:hypothetical protein Tco_0720283 [Tanacetum coccineum]